MEPTNNQKHPIELFAEKINKEGCMVIEECNTFPSMTYPYVSPQFVICIGHEGRVDLEYDSMPMYFERRNISIVYPNHAIMAHSVSPDYRCTLLVISSDFFDKLRMRSAYRGYYQYLEAPHFQLTDEQYTTICNMVNVIKAIASLSSAMREEMLIHALDVMVSLITQFRNINLPAQQQPSDEKRLFLRFYDSIVLNFRKSREVQFYANLFCLTPKYFGTLIRNETGIGAGDWIARYVVMQAKMMLRSYPDRDIQRIASDLGFDDQASFSRYFKRVEGTTPSDFRSSAKKAID